MENKRNLFDEEMKLIDTRIMLNKLIALNLQLYHAILNYAKRNGIPLPLDANLIRLAEEIEKTDIETFPQNLKLSDEISQQKRTDKDFTEPFKKRRSTARKDTSFLQLCFWRLLSGCCFRLL